MRLTTFLGDLMMRENGIQSEAEFERDVNNRNGRLQLQDLANGLFAGFMEQRHDAKQEYIPKVIFMDVKIKTHAS